MHEHYARSLEKEVVKYESLLDVGCGAYSPIKRFSKKMKYVVGVDIFEPSMRRLSPTYIVLIGSSLSNECKLQTNIV